MLKKVQKLITEGNTDLSLTELLDKADVTETEYVDALETSCTGNIVVVLIQREPHECCIKNYNSSVMQANMDIQFGLNAYACIMYVASYYHENRQIYGRTT